jgi:hypothetical protein
MIRVRRSSPDATGTSGLVEQLDTGEKWQFASVEELLRLVCAAAQPDANMRSEIAVDKPV